MAGCLPADTSVNLDTRANGGSYWARKEGIVSGFI